MSPAVVMRTRWVNSALNFAADSSQPAVLVPGGMMRPTSMRPAAAGWSIANCLRRIVVAEVTG
jgi:hypothetical protein